MASCKAYFDGLRDAGIIEDDSGLTHEARSSTGGARSDADRDQGGVSKEANNGTEEHFIKFAMVHLRPRRLSPVGTAVVRRERTALSWPSIMSSAWRKVARTPPTTLTACRDCNGSGARSLLAAPDSADAMRRMRERARRRFWLAEQIRGRGLEKGSEQEVISMKCDAYGVATVNFPKGEMTTAPEADRRVPGPIASPSGIVLLLIAVSRSGRRSYVCG